MLLTSCVYPAAPRIFLDSVDTGSESQTAERQASVAPEVMDAHGGADRFSAVATDSAESRIKMRASLAVKFPGLVPLGNQAHIANLMFVDVLKVPWASAVVENACFIRAYIRGRQTLLSQYLAKVVEFNKSKPDMARSDVHFAKPSTTRFAFYFDVLDRCGRNKSVCQAMVNDDEAFDGVSPARTADARQKKDKFCELVPSSAFWKNAKALRDVLEPLLNFLRKWDSPTAILPNVCPAVVVVEDALREIAATKQAGFVLERIPSEAFDGISKSARTRMYGPINSRVRVVHLQLIHFLATLLDPSQFDADRGCLYFGKTKEALIQHFVTSPRVFRENEMTTLTVDDLRGVLLYQLSAFISATGSFAGGVQHRGKGWKKLIVGTAWWRFFGSDYNELSRIAITVLSLSPSSYVVERSFSQQKNIHCLLRNRLEHGKVTKLP
jgi:hAT family C-terminal dimerisation region